MAQFFFFSGLDLDINFVFGLSDEAVEVFEADVDLALEPFSESHKGFLDRVDISGGDFHRWEVNHLAWLLSSS